MTIKHSGWYADMFNVKPSLLKNDDLDQSRVQGLGTHFFDELLPWFGLKYRMNQVHFTVSRMIMMIYKDDFRPKRCRQEIVFFSSHAAALQKLSLNTSLENHQQTCQLDCTWLYYVLVQICCTTRRAAGWKLWKSRPSPIFMACHSRSFTATSSRSLVMANRERLQMQCDTHGTSHSANKNDGIMGI